MNYRLVFNLPDVGFVVSNVQPENLEPFLAIRGMSIAGVNQNKRHRPELTGAPIISGMCGPMWDGDAIRYEDQRSNDILSV